MYVSRKDFYSNASISMDLPSLLWCSLPQCVYYRTCTLYNCRFDCNKNCRILSTHLLLRLLILCELFIRCMDATVQIDDYQNITGSLFAKFTHLWFFFIAKCFLANGLSFTFQRTQNFTHPFPLLSQLYSVNKSTYWI